MDVSGDDVMQVKKSYGILLMLVVPVLATAQVAILGNLVYRKTASIGSTYEGVITVHNLGTKNQEVKVYQNDYMYDASGKKEYLETGKNPRSNGKWINFTPRQFMVGPSEKFVIQYIVKVPNDSSLSGTYWCMMLVEPVVEVSPETFKKGQFTITEKVRYGIHIITDVGNEGVKKLAFNKIELIKTDTTRVMQVDLENTGETRLNISLWADLYDMEGKHVGKYSAKDDAMYPGTSIRCKIDITQVPPGIFKALIVADGGGEALFGFDYTLKLE